MPCYVCTTEWPPESTEKSTKPRPSRAKSSFSRKEELDPFPDPSLLDAIDEDQHQGIIAAVENLQKSTADFVLVTEYQTQLKALLGDHMDVFRKGFSSGPPTDVSPLKIELTPGTRPVKVRLRNYSFERGEFLQVFVSDFVRLGIAYANSASSWASAPLLVPKPGGARFRFTVDLRPVQKYTVRHQYTMQNLEQELSRLANSNYFATFNPSDGYWQLPLENESQSLQSFITPEGIYAPTRVLH